MKHGSVSGEPMRWTVRFDARRPSETLTVTGTRCSLETAGPDREAIVELPFTRHRLVQARADRAQVNAGSAVLPVYCRVRDGIVTLSNRAADLFDDGETIRLRTFVLLQQLMGANYPQNNLFADVELLEANATYSASGSGLSYQRSALLDAERRDGAGTLAMLSDRFADIAASGRPLCVLLSGGYDSRFNLAIAQHVARRHGNEVTTYHEFKNEEEASIARAVAERARVPLHVEPRSSFTGFAEEMVFDAEFIAFHSSLYRDNIPRWHGYLKWILDRVPGGVIIGLGAEAHKGKFYRQVLQLRRDSERTFGADPTYVRSGAEVMGFRGYDESDQRTYFDQLCRRASQFDGHHAQVDFVHYHTYVANGYSHRTYDFQQFFHIPFPFLDTAFLATVMALPVDAKRDFRLVRDGLAALAPELMSVPFTSGNAKALKGATPIRDMLRERLAWLRRLRGRMLKQPPRRPITPGFEARLREAAGLPRTEVTRRMLEALVRGDIRAPISPTYVLQALLLFRQMEERRGAQLELV